MTEPTNKDNTLKTEEKKYRANYSIRSTMFDGGAWMPDPDTHYDKIEFTAKDDFEAIDKAIDYKQKVGRNYFGPKVTLEKVVQFEDRELTFLKEYLRDRKKMYGEDL